MTDSYEAIQPLNVAAAAILMQLLFCGILTVTASLISPVRQTASQIAPARRIKEIPMYPVILLLSLSTLALLLISEDFANVWKPFFEGVGIRTISTNTAISLVFSLDIGFVLYLIHFTGGADSSPYSAALLTIPSLAIFLRESPIRFFGYAIAVGAAYLILTYRRKRGEEDLRSVNKLATAVTTMLLLALSMFTGYITRPMSIAEISPSVEKSIPNALAP